jgi:hypothetical protein
MLGRTSVLDDFDWPLLTDRSFAAGDHVSRLLEHQQYMERVWVLSTMVSPQVLRDVDLRVAVMVMRTSSRVGELVAGPGGREA